MPLIISGDFPFLFLIHVCKSFHQNWIRFDFQELPTISGSQASILSLLANSSWMNFFWFVFGKKYPDVASMLPWTGCHGELHERHSLKEWISKTTKNLNLGATLGNWDVASNPYKEELWREVRTKLNCFIKVCCYSVALLDCFNTSWYWAEYLSIIWERKIQECFHSWLNVNDLDQLAN